MRTDNPPKAVYLKDYSPFPYEILDLRLNFDIHDGKTLVTSTARYKKKENTQEDLFLFGEDLKIENITINAKKLENYSSDETSLTIPCPSDDEFTLEIETLIHPEKNTRLEGLYQSGGTYCTQCEAEGFRRITYFPDRPDVLTTYTVRIEANKDRFPILLSNGNKMEEGIVKENSERHYTIWKDPHPKPCYLFALVAGDLTHIHDTFKTKSNRDVDLYIYVRKGDESQCNHAMASLKKSMKWDEDVYGLEYDLDIFNIVAVSDFNMGAMENKSLNIFNTALVLAQQETATDTDFARVESVIAHEYFHNWSGNRITCRDWFQLSLKEGLTVFRDQEFSADLNSRDVQRIDDVTHLRRLQFAEDASPLAHPIRPDNYIEINNFYTMTVYEKGAEVIRMIRTILGPDKYRKATDLYFSRHDGQAATCDDWLACMEDASGIDLSQFKLWYEQAGTPRVTFEGHYDAEKEAYNILLKQETPDTVGQTDKKPLHIPVKIGLIGKDGEDLIETQILHLKKAEQSFTIENIKEKPTPSILRGFSAPVILKSNLEEEDYKYLSSFDSDGFVAWESGYILNKKLLHSLTSQIEQGQKLNIPQSHLETYRKIIEHALDDENDKALSARRLTLPDVSAIVQERKNANPEAVYSARQHLLAVIKRENKTLLETLYKQNTNTESFSISPEAVGQRALRNTALSILTSTHGTGCAKRALEHYETAKNMTDRIAALLALAPNKNPQREQAFDDFYDRFREYPLVIDKWFSVQAASKRNELINHLNKLREHFDFNIKNPNRVRSLYAAFAMNNAAGFHAADGSGYQFLKDAIVSLNTINPQIAARLLTPLRSWKSYSEDRQEMMKTVLEDILSTPDLSPDVFEITSKSLKG